MRLNISDSFFVASETFTLCFFQSEFDFTFNTKLFTLSNLAQGFELGLDVFNFLVEARTNFSSIAFCFCNECCFAALCRFLEGLTLEG